MRRVGVAVAVCFAVALAGCRGCQRREPLTTLVADGSGPSAEEPHARCRADDRRLALPGEDVVAGESALASDALWVGTVRREGTKHLASIVRASLDFGSLGTIEVGPTFSDDPPPMPHVVGASMFVSSFRRRGKDAGARGGTRWLEIARVDANRLAPAYSVPQQADESAAYDIAWRDATSGLVAWDEDARSPSGDVRGGIVKVQRLTEGAKPLVASPESSDAEAPRLVVRPEGYWLGWIARRPEPVQDAGEKVRLEGPGEDRVQRWVELVMLDRDGRPVSEVRRLSGAANHVVSFDLVPGPADQLGVLLHDESLSAEGGGILRRYAIDGEKPLEVELVDTTLGPSPMALLSQGGGMGHVLVFVDTQERAHLVSLGAGVRDVSTARTIERALDNVRVLGATGSSTLFAVGLSGDSGTDRLELRRFTCR